MKPNQLAYQNSTMRATRRMFEKSISPRDLVLLAKADALGRKIEQDYYVNESYLENALKDFEEINKEISENNK